MIITLFALWSLFFLLGGKTMMVIFLALRSLFVLPGGKTTMMILFALRSLFLLLGGKTMMIILLAPLVAVRPAWGQNEDDASFCSWPYATLASCPSAR